MNLATDALLYFPGLCSPTSPFLKYAVPRREENGTATERGKRFVYFLLEK
jgi:hypothetical protein